VCHDTAQKVHCPIGSIGSIAENSRGMTSYVPLLSPQSVSPPLTSSPRIHKHDLDVEAWEEGESHLAGGSQKKHAEEPGRSSGLRGRKVTIVWRQESRP